MSTYARRALAVLIVCSVGLLMVAPALAQSVSGSISGLVVDQTGQVVPGATITLVDEATSASRVVASNETGSFVFSAVQPGRYTVRVEMSGFRSLERTGIVLPASEQHSLGRLQLDIGGITEAVSTVAQSNIVQTASSERSALLTATQIEMVAVRGRDVMSLLRVLPGVSSRRTVPRLPLRSTASTLPARHCSSSRCSSAASAGHGIRSRARSARRSSSEDLCQEAATSTTAWW